MASASPISLDPRLKRFGVEAPRVVLADRPTPIVEVAPGFWVFDESKVSSRYGGNKVRKLELVLGRALARGATDLLTFGAAGSHHAIAVAAHAAPLGLRTRVVLLPQADTNHARRNASRTARTATVYPTGAAGVPCAVWRAWRDTRSLGGRLMVIPVGASDGLGTVGWALAGLDLGAALARGIPTPREIVVATGSGGTTAGLWLGLELAGYDGALVGVDVSGVPGASVAIRLLRAWARRWTNGARGPGKVTFTLDHEWLLGGYGRPHPRVDEAAARARAWGLSVEGTYTARSFGAALHRWERGVRPVMWVQTFAGSTDGDVSTTETPLDPAVEALLVR